MQVDAFLAAEFLGLVIVPAIAGPLLTRWAAARSKRAGSTPARVRGIEVLITIAWIAIVAVGLSATLGSISFLSTLTFSAIAGVAVTLALQTTLQNFVAGILLLQHRFLRLGDIVQFGGVKGSIVGFGLVTTVIKLSDGTLAFVSNSNLLSGPLVNLSAGDRLSGEY
ncbi:MAG TPA: mechanosensitive ion channel domain-containing protein [Thermoplasmata archaeon]|nr:mechanosensitive ion channel domain-containing protein [Thermoplasmata archaeon]